MTGIDSFLAAWVAAERTGDAETLGALLTDDFLGVGPLGFVLAKTEWIGRHRGLRYETFEVEETQPRVHGDSAVVTCRQLARGTIGGGPLPFEALRATLYLVRPDGHWQLAGIHLSFIAGTPGAPPLPEAAASWSTGQEEHR